MFFIDLDIHNDGISGLLKMELLFKYYSFFEIVRKITNLLAGFPH